MYSPGTWNVSKVISAGLAAAIVAGGAIALDQGHIAAAPRGVVEVGELVPVTSDARFATTIPTMDTSHASPIA